MLGAARGGRHEMSAPFRYVLPAVLAGLLVASPARAQFLVQPSLNAGGGIPIRSEADRFGAGAHLGVGINLLILLLCF